MSQVCPPYRTRESFDRFLGFLDIIVEPGKLTAHRCFCFLDVVVLVVYFPLWLANCRIAFHLVLSDVYSPLHPRYKDYSRQNRIYSSPLYLMVYSILTLKVKLPVS